MNILFIGQYGIPAVRNAAGSGEARVESLSRLLANQGHRVTVMATTAYSPAHIKRWGRVGIRHALSFHPDQAGGWLYSLLSLLTVFRLQPDVVHVHGWHAAALTRVAALLSPESTFVWTISSVPSDFLTRLAIWLGRGVFDAITTPARSLQYELLTAFNLRVSYVPDGYLAPTLQDIPASYFGLRKYQYCLTESADPTVLGQLLKAYGKTKSRKKLVVLVPTGSARLSRLAKRYKQLMVIPEPTPRVTASLIHQAAVFIASEATVSTANVLQAMDAGRPVVAVNYSSYQEVLGTTGQFAAQGDSEELVTLLTGVMFYPQQQAVWGKQAQKRARRHFTWPRILEEYMTAYHYPAVRRVMLDSIHQPAWRELLA